MPGTDAAGHNVATAPLGPSATVPAPEHPAEARPFADLPAVQISVDNNHCQLYGICQQEAPDAFQLGEDGRLRYEATPEAAHTPLVRQAARCCPMQAITLTQRTQEPK